MQPVFLSIDSTGSSISEMEDVISRHQRKKASANTKESSEERTRRKVSVGTQLNFNFNSCYKFSICLYIYIFRPQKNFIDIHIHPVKQIRKKKQFPIRSSRCINNWSYIMPTILEFVCMQR